MSIYAKDRHDAPTFENQLWQARRLAQEKGIEALNNPHAMTGRICDCGSCFCCAALVVYNELTQTTRNVITNRREVA